MELLQTGDGQALNALLAGKPGAVRHVLGRLWDLDRAVRMRAAEGIGMAAAHDPEMGMELMRRFVWALNDESGSNGVFVIPAMAAIATEVPEVAKPFIGSLVEALKDPGLRDEAIGALDLIGCRRPELLELYRGEISRVKDRDCSERASDGSGPAKIQDRERTWDRN
jgi:hypothetical protein